MSAGPAFSGVSRHRLAVLVLLAIAGCGGGGPTSLGDPDLAGGGGGDVAPTVKSTSPSFAERGTTLDVHVFGSGYDRGARVVWALDGDTTFALTRVKTNSTVFVSSKELLANITIEADAPIDAYDVVAVTSGGKKGIGLELFAVTLETLDLGLGDGSAAMAINDDNRIAGHGGPTGAFVWQDGVVTPLAALPGSTGANQAVDINAKGWAVGTSSNAAGSSRAVLWVPDAAGGYNPPIDLGTLGGCCSEGTAINDDGVIAGDSRLPGDGVWHAVVWDASRQVRDVHTLQGGESFAWGMNALGQVVGQWNGPTHQQAFRYTPGGAMELLPSLDGGVQGIALDINGLGQVVGWSGQSVNDPLRATLWDGSNVVDLGGGANSVGIAISDGGLVVGRATNSNRMFPFVWDSTDQLRILSRPTVRDEGQALDLNSNGWIVGETWLARGGSRATLWRPQSP